MVQMKVAKRAQVMENLVHKRIKQHEAAQHLGITERRLRQLLRQYRIIGVEALLPKPTIVPPNQYSAERKEKLRIYAIKPEHHDYGPTYMAEEIAIDLGEKISKETIRQWMQEWGLWKPHKPKKKRQHLTRERRPCVGELIQIDGSHHAWFENRGPKCALIVYIDDATSRIMQLFFCPTETYVGYINALKGYIAAHGLPMAIYSDKHGIFTVNNTQDPEHEGQTQMQRVLQSLQITQILALSPQAKGRVERCNETLQDRFVKWLRKRNIKSIEEANAVAALYVAEHNTRFAIAPAVEENKHRTCLLEANELAHLFATQTERTTTKGLKVRCNNVVYQIVTPGIGYGLRSQKVIVHEHLDGSVTITRNNRILSYKVVKVGQQILESDSKNINAIFEEVCKIELLKMTY